MYRKEKKINNNKIRISSEVTWSKWQNKFTLVIVTISELFLELTYWIEFSVNGWNPRIPRHYLIYPHPNPSHILFSCRPSNLHRNRRKYMQDYMGFSVHYNFVYCSAYIQCIHETMLKNFQSFLRLKKKLSLQSWGR